MTYRWTRIVHPGDPLLTKIARTILNNGLRVYAPLRRTSRPFIHKPLVNGPPSWAALHVIPLLELGPAINHSADSSFAWSTSVCNSNRARIRLIYSAPKGVQSIVMSMFVCLSVCLSGRSYNSKTTRPNFIKYFVHAAYTAVARFSSGRVAICCVLPVLWMTCLVEFIRMRQLGSKSVIYVWLVRIRLVNLRV